MRQGRAAIVEFYRGTIDNRRKFASMKAYFALDDITQSDH